MEECTEITVSGTGIMDTLEKIKGIQNIEEMLSMLKRVEALGDALKSVDVFGEVCCKYALLHVEALVRVVELGGIGELRGIKKKCAEWLSGLNDEQRSVYIDACAEGILITELYKREIRTKSLEKEAIEDAAIYKEMALEKLRDEGTVDIGYYADALQSKLRRAGIGEQARDIVDGMRNDIRRAGGVSVGANSRMYVVPGKCDSQSMANAIGCRLDSLRNDLRKLNELIDVGEIKFEGFIQEAEYIRPGDESGERIGDMIYDTRNLLVDFAEKAGINFWDDCRDAVIERLNVIRSLVVKEENKEEVAKCCDKTARWIKELIWA